MAEKKYDGLLVKTSGGSQNLQSHHPWYKERLQVKYLQSNAKQPGTKFLHGKDWIFMKDGLDDFRDGLPPIVSEDIFIRQDKALGPNLFGEGTEPVKVKQMVSSGRLSKEDACYSKTIPRQKHQQEYIQEVEFGLLQHPLALYPHLEESLPPEMFEDVVGIVDPEMHLTEEESMTSNSRPLTSAGLSTFGGNQTETKQEFREMESKAEENADGAKKNPYYWLPRNEEEEKSSRRVGDIKSKVTSEDAHVKQVTSEFCEWVAGLGGEKNNIEESTIASLFASGYETKPALSVPIHVVELTTVPPELRGNIVMPNRATSDRDLDAGGADQGAASGRSSEFHKFRYGAWYLPKKHWTKLDAEEALRDPAELDEEKKNEAKQRSEFLNQQLAPMHGTKSFMNFMNQKGGRKPKFIDEIAQIQKQMEEEERRKQKPDKTRLRAGSTSTQSKRTLEPLTSSRKA